MSLTPTQITARKIGGSSSAKVMGASKYCTRFEQWKYDTHQIEEEDLSDKVDIIVGNKLEEPLRIVMSKRGLKIKTEPDCLVHPDFDFWSGYIDGYRDDTVIELKTSINWRMDKDFGADGTDEIPIEYSFQVNHYLLHPRFNRAELYVVFLPIELKRIIAAIDFTTAQLVEMIEELEIRSYFIKPDMIMQEEMITEYKYYWDCVQNMTEPTLISYEEVLQRYTTSQPGGIPATDADLRALSRIKEIKSEIKTLEKEEKEKRFIVSANIGDNEYMTCEGKKVLTWKTSKNGSRPFRVL